MIEFMTLTNIIICIILLILLFYGIKIIKEVKSLNKELKNYSCNCKDYEDWIHN